jgi:hypothetical protein
MADIGHEDLLRAVVTGGVARDAPEVRLAAASDAGFARELALHLSVVDALERDGVLTRAGMLPPTTSKHHVAGFVRARAARRRRLRVAAFAGAAAVAVALGVVLLRSGGFDGEAPLRPDFPLGIVQMECREPQGEVDDFASFHWESNAVGGVFEVLVHDRAGSELARATLRDARHWAPPAQEVATWPSEIEWQVRWLDDTDSQRAVDVARARRR